MRNPLKTLSRKNLIQNVWGEDYFGTTTWLMCMCAIKPQAQEEERIIQTIRGIGFALRVDE